MSRQEQASRRADEEGRVEGYYNSPQRAHKQNYRKQSLGHGGMNLQRFFKARGARERREAIVVCLRCVGVCVWVRGGG